jgi:hypothetical protein
MVLKNPSTATGSRSMRRLFQQHPTFAQHPRRSGGTSTGFA